MNRQPSDPPRMKQRNWLKRLAAWKEQRRGKAVRWLRDDGTAVALRSDGRWEAIIPTSPGVPGMMHIGVVEKDARGRDCTWKSHTRAIYAVELMPFSQARVREQRRKKRAQEDAAVARFLETPVAKFLAFEHDRITWEGSR